MPGEVRLGPMREVDVSRVVDIHLRAFPGFFLSFLGAPFLRQLYSGVIGDATGIAIVAERDGEILGFVAGTTHPAGLYKRLISRRVLRFAFASVLPLLRRPRIMPRLFRALTMPAKSAESGEGTALLMSLAVSPDAQRSGLGEVLNRGFLDEAGKRGSKRVRLTTDRLSNEAVNQFYLRQGFKVIRTFTTPEGRQMNEYEMALDGLTR